MGSSYTFGDTDAAGARLRRLAEIYELETRMLLKSGGVSGRPRLAVDLGCGPGWSTRLIRDESSSHRPAGPIILGCKITVL